MKKIRTFFHVFWESLTHPAYYQKLLTTRFSFSFQYLFFLLFLLSMTTVIRMAVHVVPTLPQVPSFVEKTKIIIGNLYPEELIVTVNDGIVSTNVKEPYIINFPKELQGKEEKTAHLITIDTTASPEDYTHYQTLALVTRRSIVYKDSKGIKIQPLDEMKGEFIVNKALYDEIVGKILPYADILPSLVYVLVGVSILLGPLFLASITVLGKMVYLLFVSIVLWFMAKIMRKSLSYSSVYRLAIHGLTIPILIDFILTLFGQNVPFLFTGLLVLWMGFVFSTLKVSLQKSKPHRRRS